MYLYIIENRYRQSREEPTGEDIEEVEQGNLLILKYEEGFFLEIDGAGTWSVVSHR